MISTDLVYLSVNHFKIDNSFFMSIIWNRWSGPFVFFNSWKMPTLVWYCRTFLVFHAYNHNVDKKGHQTYYLEEKKLHVSQNRTGRSLRYTFQYFWNSAESKQIQLEIYFSCDWLTLLLFPLLRCLSGLLDERKISVFVYMAKTLYSFCYHFIQHHKIN